jgi:hypothetical protein
VPTALEDFYNLLTLLSGHAVNQSMLVRDAPRPPAGKAFLKCSGLPSPLNGIASDIFQQIIDLHENFCACDPLPTCVGGSRFGCHLFSVFLAMARNPAAIVMMLTTPKDGKSKTAGQKPKRS